MAKGMMGGDKKPTRKSKDTKGETAPLDMFDKIDKYIDQLSIILSVMDPLYDGGEFC